MPLPSKSVFHIFTVFLSFLLMSCQGGPPLPELKSTIGEEGLIFIQLKSGSGGFQSWDNAYLDFDASSAFAPHLKSEQLNRETSLIIKSVPPGTYRITSLRNIVGNTIYSYRLNLKFEIKPGMVNSIGLLAPVNYNEKVYTYRFENLDEVKAVVKEKYPELAANLMEDQYRMVEGKYDDSRLEKLRKFAIADYFSDVRKSPVNIWKVPGQNLYIGDLGTAGSIADGKVKVHRTNTKTPLNLLSRDIQTPVILSADGLLYEYLDNELLVVRVPEGFERSPAIRFDETGLLLIGKSNTYAVRKESGSHWKILKPSVQTGQKKWNSIFASTFYTSYTEGDNAVFFRSDSKEKSGYEYMRFDKTSYQFEGFEIPSGSNYPDLYVVKGKFFVFFRDKKNEVFKLLVKNRVSNEWVEQDTPFSGASSCQITEEYGDNQLHNFFAKCWMTAVKSYRTFESSEAGSVWTKVYR